MKRLALPFVALVAATFSIYSIARTSPDREATDPPAAPPSSRFEHTVAAVGLVEASTENIAVGTPLSGVVARVFVSVGATVEKGDPLFELDTRHLRAQLEVGRTALAVSKSRVGVARARLDDLTRQLEFAESVRDKRAVSAEEVTRRRSAVETARAELAEAEAAVEAASAEVRSIETEIERSFVRAPLNAEVLQVKLRAGEFAPAAVTASPLVVLGRTRPLHVRVDVDEHEAWRVAPGSAAIGELRGNSALQSPLIFVRFEPFVVPKKSLTGDSTERVDTRVLQVIYRIERDDVPFFVGQQMDVFVEAVRP